MRAETRRARRPKAPAPPTFTTAGEVALGAVVFDKSREMPATVRGTDGSFVEVDRPTGLTWRVHFSRIRPASAWERRQLLAVGRLHAQQRRGLT